jgi:ATP-dependent Lon protease
MLADALTTHRMFAVAMQRPGSQRETPLRVAGLGMIRVSVGHRDGTSHLVLQGLARVELEETVRYKPYRVHRFRAIATPQSDTVKVDALLTKVRELLKERITLGLPFPFPVMSPVSEPGDETPPSPLSAAETLSYLDSITCPEQIADLVSCAVLPGATQRQTILETVSVESRLGRLVQFLLAEIRAARKARGHE